MRVIAEHKPGPERVAALVRQRIEHDGERVWRLNDFADLPFTAVAQALSRLTRSGKIERLSKGIYYAPRQTALGKSRPNPAILQRLAAQKMSVFPAGVAAANLLGFTTQSGKRGEVATVAMSLPRKLLGRDTIIHTRRPAAWTGLSQEDAALLDFLRAHAKASELSPQQTLQKALALLSEAGRFERLLRAADTEPPRVRAMLGALGEQLGKDGNALERLRHSLNPFSRFDFGLLAGIPNARLWQAKERR